MAFFDWNRNGKRDFFDDFMEFTIVQEMIEEEEREESEWNNDYDDDFASEEYDW